MANIKYALPKGTLLNGKNNTYRIERALGQGSFGITYEATLLLIGSLGEIPSETKVAIKEFYMEDFSFRDGNDVRSSTGSGLSEYYKQKFIEEASKLSSMNDSGIVKVMERFSQNGTYYFVMEFLKGGTLDDRITGGNSMTYGDVLEYAEGIAKALKYMHSQLMLHLDLKPSNIMLDDHNRPVLIDFGLSKHYDENGNPETSTTIGLGTPGYAPIEQSEYQESDGFQPTMDIYALGATLFKMVTGCPPPKATILLNKPGLLDTLMERCNVPEPVVKLVIHAMEPLYCNRIQNADEFLKKLADLKSVFLKNIHAEEDEVTYVKDNKKALSQSDVHTTPKHKDERLKNDSSSSDRSKPLEEENIGKAENDAKTPVKGKVLCMTKNGKYYGLTDESSNIVIPYTYVDVADNGTFCENVCACCDKNHKWGCISTDNRIVIPFTFSTLNSHAPFKNGVAFINGKCYDRYGRRLKISDLAKWYFWVILYCVFMGLAIPFYLGTGVDLIFTLFMAILIAIIIFIIYQNNNSIYNFFISESVCDKKILNSYRNYGYVMTAGLIPVKQDDKWGYINRKGKIVIPIQYEWVSIFRGNEAWVKKNGNWMRIDTQGNERILTENELREQNLWIAGYP